MFEKAKASRNRLQAIKDLLKKQLDNYKRAIEWAKRTAVDTGMSERAKYMAKRSAQWEQKKYVLLRNEIHQDNIKQEEAKKLAQAEQKEAEEKAEMAGIELDSTDRKTLYAEIKKVTYVKFTGNKEKDDKLRKLQLTRTTALAQTYKTRMINIQNFIQRARMTADALKEQKRRYFKFRLMWENIMKIVKGMRTTVEAKESVKKEYKITEIEKESIGKTITKYKNYKSGSGDEKKDKTAGDLLLKKFEDNSRMAVQRYYKIMIDNPKLESAKVKYYQMKDRFTQISKMTGVESPAKVAIAKNLVEAQKKQKKIIVVTSIKKAKDTKEVAKALTTAGVKKEVAEVMENIEEDNEEVNQVLENAKQNPEVAEKLSQKLVEAEDENDVAEAIEDAKTEAKLKFTTDPVIRKKITEEAKIAVVVFRTDLKSKKEEKKVVKEFEEAETEEQIEKIYQKNEQKANTLEGAEVVDLRERAFKSKLDLKKKMEEYKKKINQRINDMRLKGLLHRNLMRARVSLKSLSW